MGGQWRRVRLNRRFKCTAFRLDPALCIAKCLVMASTKQTDQPQPLSDDVILSPDQAATFLGISSRTVDRMAARGDLRRLKLSPGRRGYRVGDLRAHLNGGDQ